MSILEQPRFIVDRTQYIFKKPVWRGDHTYSPDAAKYSLENIIEPEIAKKNPHWSKDQIHTEAMKKFQQRLEQDFDYEQKETYHTETKVSWHIVETSPGMRELVTSYGDDAITLRELWQHTKEFAEFVGNPYAYNAREEQAQMHMQEAFIHSDTQGYVSVLSHPDSLRYVQVWEKGDGGEVFSKQIDLYATTGRDFTHEEGERFVKHLADYEKRSTGISVEHDHIAYEHFFVDKGTVSDADIRFIARAFVSYTEQSITPSVSDKQVVEYSIPHKVYNDTYLAIRDIGFFLKEKIDQKVHALSAIDTQKKKNKADAKEIHSKANVIVSKEFRPFVLPETYVVKPDTRVDMRVFGTDSVAYQTKREHWETYSQHLDIQANTKDMHISMKDIISDYVISRSVLQYISYVPVASGAALFWFQHVEKQQKGKEKDVIVQPMTSSVNRFSFLEILPASTRRIREAIRNSWKTKFYKKVAEKMPPMFVSEKKKRLFLQLSKKLQQSGQHDHEKIKKQIYVDARTEIIQPKRDISFKERNMLRKMYRACTRLCIAMAIYRVIHLSVRKEVKMVRNETKIKKQNETVPEVSGESPWILYAIIWQLSMIREASFQGIGPTVVKAKIKKKKKRKHMKRSGVIYLRHS
jgi:hypothetical protein